MIIKSLSGDFLFQSSHKTIKEALEYCASEKIDIRYADLRRARLTNANLDGLRAASCSLWGADLQGTDLGFADLKNADLRGTNLQNTCLAESDLSDADMRGAYFHSTIVEGANLSSVKISCPSFWSCDLRGAASMSGLIYCHEGEYAFPLEFAPYIVRGLERDLVLHDDFCLWGKKLFRPDYLPDDARKSLFSLKTTIEKTMRQAELRNAVSPIPKIRRSNSHS